MNLVQKINTVVFYGNIDFVERERAFYIFHHPSRKITT